MNSIFISYDLNTNSSGGIVSRQELYALKSICDDVIEIGHNDIDPIRYGLPGDNPFMIDYLAMNKVAQLDLSHVDMVHTYSGPFTNTVKYLKAKGIKTSCTVAAHNRLESIQEFKNLGLEYPFRHVSDDVLWKMYSDFTREADVVIVPSKASAEFLKKEGVKAENIIMIPHGADIPKDYRIESVPKQFNVGYMGATGPDKGLRYLVEGWSSLNYQDSTLVIAGRGTEQLGPFIKKYAINGGNFHLMGWVENVEDFFNRIAVYVQPSITESWGMEVVEAMSSGKTVICSEGAGASECIDQGRNGFVVKKRDHMAIANRIDYLKNFESNLTGIGIAARKTAENYSWDKVRNMYVDAWRSLKKLSDKESPQLKLSSDNILLTSNTQMQSITHSKVLSTDLRSVSIEGHTIFTDRNNSLNLSSNPGYTYEPHVTEIVKKVIKPGDTVVDIGANIGYFTLLFARLVGDKGRVYAFEPDPDHFTILKKNVEINGYKNVILEQKAVSNKNGNVKLYLCDTNPGGHTTFDTQDNRKSIDVECVKLDDYFDNKKIDLIKIDIEGSEYEVIKGMNNILQRNKDIKIITEFLPSSLKLAGVNPEDFINSLIKYNFEIKDIHNNIPTDRLAEVYNTALTNLYCYRDGLAIAKQFAVKSPRIAVCTFYTPDFEYFAKYTTLGIRNYCNMYGYDYIEQTDNFIDLSPKYPYIAWNKEVLLKKVLNIKNGDVYKSFSTKIKSVDRLKPTTVDHEYKYDWVFWIDSDVVITNKSIRLEDIINIAKDKSPNDNIVDGASVDSTFFRMSEATAKAINSENKQPIINSQSINNPNDETDIIVTKEESGCCVLSAGIILIRNSEWSRKFIDDWFNKGELPGALWRDQDTFHYFYMGSEEVRKHVKVLKQKVMNSFPP